MHIVFWDSADAGSLLDRMRSAKQIRGSTFAETSVQRGDRGVVVWELTGSDPATSLRDAFAVRRPPEVVLAGTAEAVSEGVPLDTILVPTQLVGTSPPRPIRLPASASRDSQSAWRTARAAAVAGGAVPPDAVAAASLGEKDVDVVWVRNLEHLADVCDDLRVPWSVALCVRHNATQPAVTDVEAIRRQHGWASKLGAATAAFWNRPRVAVDWLRQQQRQLSAGDRLAEFLIERVRAGE